MLNDVSMREKTDNDDDDESDGEIFAFCLCSNGVLVASSDVNKKRLVVVCKYSASNVSLSSFFKRQC